MRFALTVTVATAVIAVIAVAACDAPRLQPQIGPTRGAPGDVWSLDHGRLLLINEGADKVRMSCKGEQLIATFLDFEPRGADHDVMFGPAGSLLATMAVPDAQPPGVTAMVPLPTPIVDRMSDWPAIEARYHGETRTYLTPPREISKAFVDACNAGAAAARRS